MFLVFLDPVAGAPPAAYDGIGFLRGLEVPQFGIIVFPESGILVFKGRTHKAGLPAEFLHPLFDLAYGAAQSIRGRKAVAAFPDDLMHAGRARRRVVGVPCPEALARRVAEGKEGAAPLFGQAKIEGLAFLRRCGAEAALLDLSFCYGKGKHFPRFVVNMHIAVSQQAQGIFQVGPLRHGLHIGREALFLHGGLFFAAQGAAGKQNADEFAARGLPGRVVPRENALGGLCRRGCGCSLRVGSHLFGRIYAAMHPRLHRPDRSAISFSAIREPAVPYP